MRKSMLTDCQLKEKCCAKHVTIIKLRTQTRGKPTYHSSMRAISLAQRLRRDPWLQWSLALVVLIGLSIVLFRPTSFNGDVLISTPHLWTAMWRRGCQPDGF